MRNFLYSAGDIFGQYLIYVGHFIVDAPLVVSELSERTLKI